jgi:DNA topoisomerase IB
VYVKDDMAVRRAALKQSIRESASFPANTPTVARGRYAHPLVHEAFTGEAFDPARLFAGPQRKGLTRGETALLRLLKRKAEK